MFVSRSERDYFGKPVFSIWYDIMPGDPHVNFFEVVELPDKIVYFYAQSRKLKNPKIFYNVLKEAFPESFEG